MLQLVNSCQNATDVGLDDDNSGSQFGHAILSGKWELAVSSWASIGTVDCALKLLAALFHVRRIALQGSAQQDTSLLVDVYIVNIVSAMRSAWDKEVSTRKSVWDFLFLFVSLYSLYYYSETMSPLALPRRIPRMATLPKRLIPQLSVMALAKLVRGPAILPKLQTNCTLVRQIIPQTPTRRLAVRLRIPQLLPCQRHTLL
jgi:hypothetical protein